MTKIRYAGYDPSELALVFSMTDTMKCPACGKDAKAEFEETMYGYPPQQVEPFYCECGWNELDDNRPGGTGKPEAIGNDHGTCSAPGSPGQDHDQTGGEDYPGCGTGSSGSDGRFQ